MRISATFIATAIGIFIVSGCADPGPTTTTTTVTRDSAGNPIAGGSVTRDANGNIISSSPGAYQTAPVPPAYPSPPYRRY
jgi:hypothetical protein